jgi:ubiquinone/menaquinone biosynthesis C-methylase UbiE
MSDVTSSVIDIYDSIAQNYSDTYVSDESDRKYIDEFLKKLPKEASILDAGCGPGQNAVYMLKKGFNVTGIDLSDSMIKITKKTKFPTHFRKMDMRNLKFPAGSFDGILASYSLIHVMSSQVVRVLSGFSAVMKKGGILALFVQKGQRDHYTYQEFSPVKQTFFNFFTADVLKSQLAEAGFTDITVKEVPCDDVHNLSDTNLFCLAVRA